MPQPVFGLEHVSPKQDIMFSRLSDLVQLVDLEHFQCGSRIRSRVVHIKNACNTFIPPKWQQMCFDQTTAARPPWRVVRELFGPRHSVRIPFGGRVRSDARGASGAAPNGDGTPKRASFGFLGDRIGARPKYRKGRCWSDRLGLLGEHGIVYLDESQ